MKNILFLDDSPERTEKFKAAYPEAVCVETAAECIEKLRSGVWHVVCLDHDLGGKEYVPTDSEDCGMEVVRWMVRNRPFVGRVIVHTWNEPAAKVMVSELRRRDYAVSYAPFGASEWRL